MGKSSGGLRNTRPANSDNSIPKEIRNAPVNSEEGPKGILQYGKVGYAVFKDGKQITRALFGNRSLTKAKNGYADAKEKLDFYKKFGFEKGNLTIAKALRRY